MLLIDVLRQPYPRRLKAALVLVLLIPIGGPFFYLWIRSFSASNRDELMDHQSYELDILNRWRDRLEAAGFLSPRWSQHGSVAKTGQSIWEEEQDSAADAAARAAKREARRLRRAPL